MPLIKASKRELFDGLIEDLVAAIKCENDEVEKGSRGKNTSYAIYALIKSIYELGNVQDMIEAVGVLTETLLALYTLEVLPFEQMTISRRWFTGNASSPKV